MNMHPIPTLPLQAIQRAATTMAAFECQFMYWREQSATALPPGALPLPYPQTPKSAGNYIQLNGLCISEISRLTGISRYTFVDLLSGKQKGRRGNAHRAAVLLGLKPAPQSANAGAHA